MTFDRKIDFRTFSILAGYLFLFCIVLNSCSKKTHKVYRVGIICGADTFADIANGFTAKMNQLGYIEGRNIIYDIHKFNANPAGENQAARKFVNDKFDMIFAFPTEPALTAKRATRGTGIPVIFALGSIEKSNLVENVSNPGNNITGVRFPGPELTAKRLEILNEIVPKARRVYLIYDPNYPTAPSAIEQLRKAAAALDIKLVEDTVSSIEEIKAALSKRSASAKLGIDAILIMPEVLTQTPQGFSAIMEFANKYKLPVAGALIFTAEQGAIFSLAPNNFEVGELAASLADRILKGEPAGSIMVITPPAHLVINYRAMQQLGLSTSEGLLSKADRVIR